MTVEVGGAGVLGVAPETTLGTYVAPTKWIPIRSETLQQVEDKIYRMNLRGTADRTGAIQGYTHIEGDVTFEVSPDVFLYFAYAMRVTPSRSGAGPYTYTFVPAHVAKASTAAGVTNRKTLSILIHRGGNAMAYRGMSVGQIVLSTEDGLLLATVSMIGTAYSNPSLGTPSYTVTEVIGPGDTSIEIPTASARADAETATLTINDNLTTANRLNGSRSAAYQNWGEREVTLSVDIDFDTLTDVNTFINQTEQAISFKGIISGTEEVTVVLNKAIQDAAPANLAGLGEVNRMSMDYHAIYGTTDAYTMTVKTAENMT